MTNEGVLIPLEKSGFLFMDLGLVCHALIQGNGSFGLNVVERVRTTKFPLASTILFRVQWMELLCRDYIE